MKLGVTVPQFGINSTKENLLDFIDVAERENFESLWVFDRLLYPINPKQPYPGTPEKEKWPDVCKNVLDPLTTLTFVAANTSKPILGTAVIDMIFHNPVELAKKFSTIDILSDGRLICGLGIGWSEDEFVASNVPFKNRGKRADEFLAAMREVLTKDTVEFQGDFYKIPKSIINPKPKQKPHPKILLGGFSPKTFERMVNYGDGYLGAHVGPIENLEKIIQQFNHTIESHQKRRNDFEFNFLIFPFFKEKSSKKRTPLTGTIEEIGKDLEEIKNLGVERLILGINSDQDYNVKEVANQVKNLEKYCS